MKALFALGAVFAVCNFLFAVGSLLAFAFVGWEPWAPLNMGSMSDFYRLCLIVVYYAASIGFPFFSYIDRDKKG